MVRKRDIRQIDAIARKVGLTRGQRSLLHNEIHGRSLSHSELVDIARQVKKDYPNK